MRVILPKSMLSKQQSLVKQPTFKNIELELYSSNQFDHIFSPQENYIYIAPVFVGFIQEEQQVILNDEHSAYEWFPFEKAKEVAGLPGNEVVLQSIENNFVRKKPLRYLKV